MAMAVAAAWGNSRRFTFEEQLGLEDVGGWFQGLEVGVWSFWGVLSTVLDGLQLGYPLRFCMFLYLFVVLGGFESLNVNGQWPSTSILLKLLSLCDSWCGVVGLLMYAGHLCNRQQASHTWLSF